MFIDRDSLRKTLAKRRGFFQSTDSNYPVLSPILSSSTDGRYVNEVNGLITNENIDQTQKNFMKYPFPAWGGDTITYAVGEVFSDSGINYESIQAVIVGIAITDPLYWFPLDDTNNYLYQKLFQGVDKAIDSVFNDKKMRAITKSIFENTPLFDGVANYRDKEANQNKFVGLRFVMKTDTDLATIINKIGHQFTEAVSFNMYLYHSSQQEPLLTIPINHTKANSSQWTAQTALTLRYISDDYDSSGEFFLGYAQSELGTAQALNKEGIDWYNGFECRSCWGRSYAYYQNYSPWVSISAFSVPESSFIVGTDLFDPSLAAIGSSQTYGLNLVMTSRCDLTPFAEDQAYLFDEAINNAAGLEILRDMASNLRGTNNLAVTVKAEAEKQVFGDTENTVVVLTKNSLKGLSFDLSGLQSECLPCDSGDADVIYGTVTLR